MAVKSIASDRDLAKVQLRIKYLKKHDPRNPDLRTLQAEIGKWAKSPNNPANQQQTTTGDTGGGTTADPGAEEKPPPPPGPTGEAAVGEGNPGGQSSTTGVGTGLTNEDDANALRRALEQIQAGETFGRNLANEFFYEGSMGRLDENRTAEELALLDRFTREADTAGQRSEDVQGLIDRRKAGLEGYNAAENAALREVAEANIRQRFLADQGNLRRAQARAGVRGSAVTAQNMGLGKARMEAQRGLERELLVENVQEKNRRLSALQDLVNQSESNEFTRRTTALNNLGSQTNYQGQVDTARKQYNQGQANAESAGRIGSIFGGVGSVTGLTGGIRAEEIAKRINDQVLENTRKQTEIYQKAMEAYTKGLKKAA